MLQRLGRINAFIEHWVRKRFALPVALLFAMILLLVSENTYRGTTSTLRGGIELTDARIQSLRLLQLLTDAEAAQYGFLVTGQPEYQARFAAAQAELPAVLGAVQAFFSGLGSGGAAASTRVVELTQRKFGQFEHALALARSGELPAAIEQVQDSRRRDDLAALRQELTQQLALAASMQGQARTSIYDALLVNRVAVGALTLVAVLLLSLFMRQLQVQDRERRLQEAALRREREGLEAEVARRTERLAELARHLQAVREDERARLARELHDELGSLLTASKLDIARARMKVAEPAEMLLRLERVSAHLNNGIALKRRIIEDLRPSALSNLGLTAALRNLCDDMSGSLGFPIDLTTAEFNLGADAELAVYRFVQEALTNVGKYAEASRVEVTLAEEAGLATVLVRDNGVGFDAQHPRVGHHGLSGMQFRAESLGGAMQIHSAPGQGTLVRIAFPQAAG